MGGVMGLNFMKLLGADDAAGAVKIVGNAVGGGLDRLGFTKKMSEVEKIDKTIELIKVTSDSDKLDIEDLKAARDMAIAQMQTQKASWIVRQLNGGLRPFAGWYSLICVSDKVWSQVLSQIFENFVWQPVEYDPVTKGIFAGILAFFFGFRQRSKEKQVTLLN
jgi:hypothetical protein